MLSIHRVAIEPADNATSLHDKLAVAGAAAVVEALVDLPALQAGRQKQPEAGVTYAEKLRKEESLIDWQHSATDLDRMIRAFNPFPSAQTTLGGEALKIWRAEPVAGSGQAGEIIQADRHGLIVATGEGALRLVEVQKAGGKRMDAAALLAGGTIATGIRLGAEA
jgi:methionyl-tRNA formyltransferase